MAFLCFSLAGLALVQGRRFTPVGPNAVGFATTYSKSVSQTLGLDGQLHAISRETEVGSGLPKGVVKECRDGACKKTEVRMPKRAKALEDLFDAPARESAVKTFDSVGAAAWSFLDGAPLSPELFHTEEESLADGFRHLHPMTLWKATTDKFDDAMFEQLGKWVTDFGSLQHTPAQEAVRKPKAAKSSIPDTVGAWALHTLDAGTPMDPELFHAEADLLKAASKADNTMDTVGAWALHTLDAGTPMDPELFHAEADAVKATHPLATAIDSLGSFAWSLLDGAPMSPALFHAETDAVLHPHVAAGPTTQEGSAMKGASMVQREMAQASKPTAKQASVTRTVIVSEKDGRREETKIYERCAAWRCERMVRKPNGEIERSEITP